MQKNAQNGQPSANQGFLQPSPYTAMLHFFHRASKSTHLLLSYPFCSCNLQGHCQNYNIEAEILITLYEVIAWG